jgi:hypothetical protein
MYKQQRFGNLGIQTFENDAFVSNHSASSSSSLEIVPTIHAHAGCVPLVLPDTTTSTWAEAMNDNLGCKDSLRVRQNYRLKAESG